MLKDLFHHRYLLRLLVLREIRIRYARAALGVGWALFLPLVMMLVFSVLNFGRLIPETSPYKGLPYTLFAYCGLLFWTHFATSLTQATPSLVVAGNLLKKCSFPHETIPLAKVLSAIFDLAIGAAFLIGLMLWHGSGVGLSLVAIPVVLLLQLMFTVGLVLLCSAANLFFRDVNYLVQVGVVLAMFATSVVYPVNVGGETAQTVLGLNPMSAYLNAYREILLLGRWPSTGLAVGVCGALISFVTGTLAFRRLSRRFAEEV